MFYHNPKTGVAQWHSPKEVLPPKVPVWCDPCSQGSGQTFLTALHGIRKSLANDGLADASHRTSARKFVQKGGLYKIELDQEGAQQGRNTPGDASVLRRFHASLAQEERHAQNAHSSEDVLSRNAKDRPMSETATRMHTEGLEMGSAGTSKHAASSVNDVAEQAKNSSGHDGIYPGGSYFSGWTPPYGNPSDGRGQWGGEQGALLEGFIDICGPLSEFSYCMALRTSVWS